MRVGIPAEMQTGEARVALTPGVAPLLLRDGHEVLVEAGAGVRAHFDDALYAQAGARIIADVRALYAQVEAVFKVRPPGFHTTTQIHETEMLPEGAVYIGLLDPYAQLDVVRALARRRITSYAMELIPRISRAQSMDALTSMATVAGYKAVLIAADRLGKMFPLLMTAAGTIAPATVLVLGAGVAGLQAIATAKRLGAKVVAFDPRPAVREQVQSLGASFLDMELPEQIETAGGYAMEQSTAFLRREQDTIAARLPEVDVVICAAQVFGKRAPVLITGEMARAMHSGAILVDLAADQGGNCELTQPGAEIEQDGIIIIAAGNLPALVPTDASQLYARNVVNLFRYLYPADGQKLDPADEILRDGCLTRDGEIVNAAIDAAAREGAPA